MLYHAAMAFYCYGSWNTSGVTTFVLGAIGSGVLSAVGLWCVMFGSANGRISKKTGADKRTSGFPFANKEAEKKKAKNF
jgi:hypothetical protein